jgi:hypothetical protein
LTKCSFKLGQLAHSCRIGWAIAYRSSVIGDRLSAIAVRRFGKKTTDCLRRLNENSPPAQRPAHHRMKQLNSFTIELRNSS